MLLADEAAVDQDCGAGTDHSHDDGTDKAGCAQTNQIADEAAHKGTDDSGNEILRDICAVKTEQSCGQVSGAETNHQEIKQTQNHINYLLRSNRNNFYRSTEQQIWEYLLVAEVAVQLNRKGVIRIRRRNLAYDFLIQRFVVGSVIKHDIKCALLGCFIHIEAVDLQDTVV